MKKWKNILTILIIIFVTFVFTFVMEYKLHDTIKNIKSSIVELKEQNFMHKNINKIKNLKSLEDEANAWYMNYHFISHAGGGTR